MMVIPRTSRTRIMLLGVAMVVIALLGAIAMGYYLEIPTTSSRNDYVRTWVIYGAALVALLGWIVSAYVSLTNSIKQHTVSFILQARLSTAFNAHREALISVYPDRPKMIVIPESDIERLKRNKLGKEKYKAIDSLNYMLNHFEFIAAGIHHGDLDEPLLKSCYRGIVCNMYKKGINWIKYVRGENKKGEVTKPKVYEHLIRLCNRWEKG